MKKISYLIESGMERTEVVIAAKSVTDKLQTIAEQLAKVEADDIMPILDSMREMFSPQAADQFSEVATNKIREVIDVIKSAKGEIGNQINRLEQGIETGNVPTPMDDKIDMGGDDLGGEEDMDDMATDLNAPPEPEDHGMDFPEPDHDMSNAAGRARKESRQYTKKALNEFFDFDVCEKCNGKKRIGHASCTACNGKGYINDKHDADCKCKECKAKKAKNEGRMTRGRKLVEYKSPSYEPNIAALTAFDDKAGNIARDIERTIDDTPLPQNVRVNVSNVLNHLASLVSDPANWSDPEELVTRSLGQFNVHSDPVIAGIIKKLNRLAHCISLKHEDVIEGNHPDFHDLPFTDENEMAPHMYESLRDSKDPDRVVLETFRRKLASTNNPKQAARITAESFFIDISDVVDIVKEAKAKKVVKEFEMHTPASKKGMFKGKTEADLKKMRTSTKEKAQKSKDKGEHVPEKVKTKEKEIDFALRAKKTGTGKDKWHKKVTESDHDSSDDSQTFFDKHNSAKTPNDINSNEYNPSHHQKMRSHHEKIANQADSYAAKTKNPTFKKKLYDLATKHRRIAMDHQFARNKKMMSEATVDHIQGVPMFPVGQSSPVKAGQAATPEPEAAGQNGPAKMGNAPTNANGNKPGVFNAGNRNVPQGKTPAKQMAPGSVDPAMDQEENVDDQNFDPNGSKATMKPMTPDQRRQAARMNRAR